LTQNAAQATRRVAINIQSTLERALSAIVGVSRATRLITSHVLPGTLILGFAVD